MIRFNKVVEVSISNFCNFSCDYCISESINRKIPINSDGSVRRFKDLRYNKNGVIDFRRIKKYGLIVKGELGKTHNYGIELPDGSIDRSGEYVIENDFIDYEKLLFFIRKYLKDWVVQIGGGEPLHNPGICDFLIELSKTNNIILLTNLSLLRSKKEILNIPDNRLFYRVGFHPEFYNIEFYLRNLNILKNSNKKYLVNYVLHPRHEINGMAKAYVDFLKDNNFNYEVTLFYGKYNGETFPRKCRSKMELELLSEHVLNPKNTFSIHTPGTTYLAIYPDGNIYQCSKKTVCLGSIYNSVNFNYRLPMKECFFDGLKCQSIISQEYVFSLWNS